MSHRAKKSLGQHFLRSMSAVRSIVEAGLVTPVDTVLEIGPGEGVLTEALLATGAHIVAVEKDRDLIPILTERFAVELENGQLTLIEADILDFDPLAHKLEAGKYKLVANIPYYITGAIFEKFLSEKNSPITMVVLIQKEVATRIVARDNKESILSISVKAFGTPKLTAKVPASAFRQKRSDSPFIRSACAFAEGSRRRSEAFRLDRTCKSFHLLKRGCYTSVHASDTFSCVRKISPEQKIPYHNRGIDRAHTYCPLQLQPFWI
jgi:16S rRNA A1518/A1519 N6-dimethyltransferase RsmA/KsgA/DIM1 with predicted DNA glycosylase/AP lyase activity